MIKYKLSEYSMVKKEVMKWYLDKGLDHVKMSCVYSHIPLLIAVGFVNKEYPSEEAKDTIKYLEDYYKAELIDDV